MLWNLNALNSLCHPYCRKHSSSSSVGSSLTGAFHESSLIQVQKSCMSSGGREMESDKKSDIAGGKTVGAHSGFSERGWGSWISRFKQEIRLNALMSCKVVTWQSCSWTASAITVLCWGISSMRRDWWSKKRCVDALSKTGYWIAAGIPPEFDAGISIIQMSSTFWCDWTTDRY